HETLYIMPEIGLEESIVVLEGYAAVGIAVRPEHVSVGEDPAPTERPSFVLRDHAQRAHAMERLFAQFEVVNVRWGNAAHSLIRMLRIIEPAAETGMGFEPGAVRHVDRVRGYIVDRSEAVVLSRADAPAEAKTRIVSCGISKRDRRRFAEEFLEKCSRVRHRTGAGLVGSLAALGVVTPPRAPRRNTPRPGAPLGSLT